MTESILVKIYISLFLKIFKNFVDLAGSEKVSMHDPMRTKKRDASAGTLFYF